MHAIGFKLSLGTCNQKICILYPFFTTIILTLIIVPAMPELITVYSLIPPTGNVGLVVLQGPLPRVDRVAVEIS